MEKMLNKTVKEFMTKRVIAVREGESLKNLFKILRRNGILGVPVVTKAGKVIGMVTESDLIRHFTLLKTPKAISVLGSILYLDDIRQFNKSLKDHCAETVKLMMTKKPVTVREKATLLEAISLMAGKKVNRLPVVDAKGKLLGIVTRTDILRQMAKFKTI
ncbi:CBS domain-containing protein [Candidatus Peregrinibacteria bacterium]|nr:CBS domain-containing protein [Candidatus Peregrinibacteria bacterium]